MKDTHARRLRQISSALAIIALASCSSSSDGDDSGGEVIDAALVADVRSMIMNEGLTPAPAAPSFSPELVALGQALFFDKELSGNRDVSCATCHLPGVGAADGRALPGGVHGTGLATARTGGDVVPRNSPTVLNAHVTDEAFWDGRVSAPLTATSTPALSQLTPAMIAVIEPSIAAIAAQAMFPPTSRAEMRGLATENEIADVSDGDFTGIWNAIVARFVSFPTYQNMFTDAYPGTLIGDINMAHIGNAIGAFEATAFHRVDSPWQRFLLGDDAAMTNAQLRGALEYFRPQSRCVACHSGPFFTDFSYRNIGMPQFGPGHGDGLGGDDDFGREVVSGNMNDRYRFRTPTLLNVELTAPYGHTGQFGTLRSMLEHYRNVTASLNNYDIMTEVSDTTLFGTQIGNESDVLMGLDMAVSNPINFNVADMESFMQALTAYDAIDLSDVVPATVPSGLSIDQ